MADEQDLLSHYADRAGIQSDTDFILANVKAVNDALDKLAAVRVGLGSATTAKAAGEEAAKAKPAIDAVTAATEKLLKSQSDTAKQVAILNVQTQEQNKTNKEAAKEALGMVDAYGRLSLQYRAAAKETQNIVVQYGKYSEQAKASAAATQVLYQRLVDADAAVGKFGRNVGNYPTVFKTFGETGKQAVEKVNEGFKDMLKNIAATVVAFVGVRGLFEFGKESIEGFEKMEVQTKRLENALHNMGASAKDVTELKGQVIELANALPYLSKTDLREVQQKLVQYGKLSADQIKALTPTIIDFAANARIGVGEATDVIVKAMEGNARALKAYGINVKEAGSESERFSLIQTELERRVKGSAELFAESSQGKIEAYKRQLGGLKTEIGGQLIPVYESFLNHSIDLIKVIKSIDFANVVKGAAALTAIWLTYRAVVLGASIATAFNTAAQVAARAASEGCTIAKAAETLAEETNGKVKNANTILTYLLVGAQKAYAFVVKLATTEVQLFNTAIKVSPLGLFLTVLGAAVVLFSTLSANASTTAVAINNTKEKIEATNEIMKKANETFAGQREVIESLVDKVKDHTLKLADRKKALEELIALDPKYLNGLSLENIETEKGTALIDKYVDALQRKAFAEAAQQTLVEIAKEQVNIQADTKTAQDNLNEAKKEKQKIDATPNADKEARGLDQFGAIAAQTSLKSTIDDLDAKGKKLQEKVDLIKQIIKTAGASDAQFNQTGLQDKLKKAGPDTTNADDAAKAAEELAKFLLELDDKLAKAKREHAAEELKRIADDAKEVIDDNRNALDKRLQALDIYSQAQAAIINRNAESEIQQEQKKLQRIAEIKKKNPLDLTDEEDKIRHTEELVTQTIINLQQKRDDLQYKLAKDNGKLRDDVIKSNADREITERLSAYNQEKALDQAAYSDELTRLSDAYNEKFQAARGNVKKQEKISAEFNAKRLELQDEFIVESLKKDIDFAQQQLEVQKSLSTNTLADKEKIATSEQKLADLKLKLKDAETKWIIDKNNQQKKSDEEVQAARLKFLNQVKDIYEKVTGAIDGVISASVDNQKAALQGQIDDIEKNKEKQIDAVNAQVLSQDEKAKKIDGINKRAQANEERLQLRQKQLDVQKAQFEKAINIGKIIINTALAVSKALFEGGPFYAAFVGALGAAELAIAIAAPIPKLKDGTKDSKAGPHWLGDGGKRELAIMPDGKAFISPATDTLFNLPAHTIVYPDADALLTGLMSMSFKPLSPAPALPVFGPAEMQKVMHGEFNRMISAYQGKRENHFHWDNGELRRAIKNGSDWTRYIQDNI